MFSYHAKCITKPLGQHAKKALGEAMRLVDRLVAAALQSKKDCTHYIIPEIKVLFYHPVHYRLLRLRLLQTKAILNGGLQQS